jgi:hypothetical protein
MTVWNIPSAGIIRKSTAPVVVITVSHDQLFLKRLNNYLVIESPTSFCFNFPFDNANIKQKVYYMQVILKLFLQYF